MGKKDITEKMLEDYNDVFADIMNVVLFHGEQTVVSRMLQEANSENWYEDMLGDAREQRRDIAKYWKKGRIQFVLFGIENQTAIDNRMPLRVISYDGVAYMSQYKKKVKHPYPVVTIVLYFGNERWKRNKSLSECLTIPKEVAEYVNDYRIHVCEVAYLTDEQIAMFQSDFKVVAEFFVKRRKDKNYVPESTEELKHVREVLNLLSAVTKDDCYKQVYENRKEQVKNMCEVADRLRQQGIQQGENMLSRLMSALYAAGRIDDAKRAIEDVERRQQLYREMGIIDERNGNVLEGEEISL